MKTALAITLFICGISSGFSRAQQADVVFADFEGEKYGNWIATGTAFGDGPAAGALPGQMNVSGFAGKRLVNSFHGGDVSTGTLTSPEFKIERRYISYLIGGGGHEGKTCMNLLVDGKVARSATGSNTRDGGSEALEPRYWDVAELMGKSARIQIVDEATGGWGHVNVDQIAFTDAKPKGDVRNAKREVMAQNRLLMLPVKNGGKVRHVTVSVGGEAVRDFTIEAADGKADWWAPLDISTWQGKALVIEVDRLPEDSQFLPAIAQQDAPNASSENYGEVYQEALRPQFHFSPKFGWTNDPNGMVYFNGEYHLFFQHNPYGTQWGNMHWGHAVSKDMIHWSEVGEALYPDALGPMFSGSAVVDAQNTSGFGEAGKPPLVLIYTAAGNPEVQCIASSTDGRTFTKYAQNPVVKNITGGNRDPKVIWHEPSKQWVLTLYVGYPKTPEKAANDTIQFFTSPNLKDWTFSRQIDGFFECPDFFPLAVDGDAKNTKWVLTAASSDYMVGSFDGKKFTPETPKLKGHRGRGFYAAQTFSDLPASDGRRIQIGWFQAPAPGMPFNQAMTVPLELKLIGTAEGPRLSWTPVKELESLRGDSKKFGPTELKDGDDALASAGGETLDVRMDFQPGDAKEVGLNVRGVTIRYDVAKQELSVNDLKAPAPLRGGRQRLIVLADRNCFEVFASDGLTYVPYPVIPKASDLGVRAWAKGGTAKIHSVEVNQLKGIWKQASP